MGGEQTKHENEKPSQAQLLQEIKELRDIVSRMEDGEAACKRAEEAMRKSEEKYLKLFENLNVGVYRITPGEHGRFIDVNPAFVSILGYGNKDEILALNVSDIYKEPKNRIKFSKNIFKHGFVKNEELRLKKKDGTTIIVADTGIAVLDDNGEIAFFDGIMEDITARRWTEGAQQLSNRVLEIANKQLDKRSLFNELAAEVQGYSGCAAAGIRLLDEDGNIPYQGYTGFSKKFYESESPLSIKSHQCMCINVIKGGVDPKQPFFTAGGSFYMNATTRFLATIPEEDKGNTRNVCNETGYESVALVPITFADHIYGLIHVADTKENMVPLNMVKAMESVAKQLGVAVQRILSEVTLHESEEQFRDLAEKSFDVIFMLDRAGVYRYISPAVERSMGYSTSELIGRPFTEFLPVCEQEKAEQILNKMMQGEELVGLELEILNKNRVAQYFEINATPIIEDKTVTGLQGIAREITTRKRAEDELKKRLMKFNLEEGELYLIQEGSPTMSVEVVNDLVKVGYDCLILSRTPRSGLRNLAKDVQQFFWLSERKGENTFQPNLPKLERLIESQPRRKIILLERLDYLISKHDFNKVLGFVQHLKEYAIIYDLMIILSLDPDTLESQKLRMLEKESAEVRLSKISSLPEDQIEILKFINNQNIMGLKPSQSSIMKELRISKPTTRKRLRRLVAGDYIIEHIKGRKKVLELTEQGKRIFS